MPATCAFLPNLPAGTIGYQLKDHAGGDNWDTITVLFNGTGAPAIVPLPTGKYRVVLRGQQLDERGLGKLRVRSGTTVVPASSALLLVQ